MKFEAKLYLEESLTSDLVYQANKKQYVREKKPNKEIMKMIEDIYQLHRLLFPQINVDLLIGMNIHPIQLFRIMMKDITGKIETEMTSFFSPRHEDYSDDMMQLARSNEGVYGILFNVARAEPFLDFVDISSLDMIKRRKNLYAYVTLIISWFYHTLGANLITTGDAEWVDDYMEELEHEYKNDKQNRMTRKDLLTMKRARRKKDAFAKRHPGLSTILHEREDYDKIYASLTKEEKAVIDPFHVIFYPLYDEKTGANDIQSSVLNNVAYNDGMSLTNDGLWFIHEGEDGWYWSEIDGRLQDHINNFWIVPYGSDDFLCKNFTEIKGRDLPVINKLETALFNFSKLIEELWAVSSQKQRKP